MSTFNQEIRFARAGDGVRLAYAVAGTGYPLVRSTHWLTNIEFDWQTPSVGPLLERLAARYRLIRYNPRGYGLSEGEGMALCLDSFVNDLETVVDAAGLDRFALYGASGGGPISIAYAARHPDRVSHLVLVGGYARGLLHRNPTPEQKERLFATIKLIESSGGVMTIPASARCSPRSSSPMQRSSRWRRSTNCNVDQRPPSRQRRCCWRTNLSMRRAF